MLGPHGLEMGSLFVAQFCRPDEDVLQKSRNVKIKTVHASFICERALRRGKGEGPPGAKFHSKSTCQELTELVAWRVGGHK